MDYSFRHLSSVLAQASRLKPTTYLALKYFIAEEGTFLNRKLLELNTMALKQNQNIALRLEGIQRQQMIFEAWADGVLEARRMEALRTLRCEVLELQKQLAECRDKLKKHQRPRTTSSTQTESTGDKGAPVVTSAPEDFSNLCTALSSRAIAAAACKRADSESRMRQTLEEDTKAEREAIEREVSQLRAALAKQQEDFFVASLSQISGGSILGGEKQKEVDVTHSHMAEGLEDADVWLQLQDCQRSEKKLRYELEEAEATKNRALQELATASHELDKSQSQLHHARLELGDTRSRLEDARQQLDEAAERLAAGQRRMLETREEVRQVLAAAERELGETEELGQELEATQANYHQALAEVEELRQRLEEKEAEHNKLVEHHINMFTSLQHAEASQRQDIDLSPRHTPRSHRGTGGKPLPEGTSSSRPHLHDPLGLYPMSHGISSNTNRLSVKSTQSAPIGHFVPQGHPPGTGLMRPDVVAALGAALGSANVDHYSSGGSHSSVRIDHHREGHGGGARRSSSQQEHRNVHHDPREITPTPSKEEKKLNEEKALISQALVARVLDKAVSRTMVAGRGRPVDMYDWRDMEIHQMMKTIQQKPQRRILPRQLEGARPDDTMRTGESSREDLVNRALERLAALERGAGSKPIWGQMLEDQHQKLQDQVQSNQQQMLPSAQQAVKQHPQQELVAQQPQQQQQQPQPEHHHSQSSSGHFPFSSHSRASIQQTSATVASLPPSVSSSPYFQRPTSQTSENSSFAHQRRALADPGDESSVPQLESFGPRHHGAPQRVDNSLDIGAVNAASPLKPPNRSSIAKRIVHEDRNSPHDGERF